MPPTSVLKPCSRGAVSSDGSCKAVTWDWSFISREDLSIVFVCVGWGDYTVPPALSAVPILHRIRECGGGECWCDMKPIADENLLETKQVFSANPAQNFSFSPVEIEKFEDSLLPATTEVAH